MRARLVGVSAATSVFVFFCFGIVLAQSASQELNLGVQAFRQAKYEEAARHFEKAASLDPDNTNAHLYLATAYAQQYIPGVETAENNHLAEMAIEQYRQVLDSGEGGSTGINSAKGIAYLYLNMKNFDEAKQYYETASGLDPQDPEPYYSIGVIDWTRCYQPRMEARTKLGLPPDQSLDPSKKDQKKVCDELRARNESIIAEGIEDLNKAIRLKPDYDDAMAYLNLLYREKADIECDNFTVRAEDLKTAEAWVDKTLAVKKLKEQKVSGTVKSPPDQR
jgi:tetratricopeptide (TPR) repeat protein